MSMSGELNFPPEKYYPFESRWLEIKGIELHYINEYTGRKDKPEIILFLHGNPTWSFLYRNIIIKLRNEYRCIALDYPGFGLSEKPENFSYLPADHSKLVQKFIKRLSLSEFNLMVHDWGGPIGLGVVGRKPELVKRLIITNTWAWPVERKLLKLFSRIVGSKLGKRLILSRNAFVNYIMPWGIIKNRRKFYRQILPNYRFPFQKLQERLPTYIFPREIVRSRDFLVEVEANLDEIADKSAMLLWGKWDLAFRKPERSQFMNIFQPKQVVKLSAGHYLQEDRPQKISKYIRKFIG